MTAELVINARYLSGDGPLWMLHEAAAGVTHERIRLIVSDERTATAVMAVLMECGMTTSLDPIGEDYHILGQPDRQVCEALAARLNPQERQK